MTYHLDYRSRLCSPQLLPLMMYLEIADINDFFLSYLLDPSPSFNISQYVSFSSSNTHSSGTKLQHRYSPNNLFRHFYFNRLPPSLDLITKLFSPSGKVQFQEICGYILRSISTASMSAHIISTAHVAFPSTHVGL